MTIPCSIMDEHRDAFWHWHVMIDKGYIAPEGNYLLHIDHHDDNMGGTYQWDMEKMPQNAKEALVFTDRCLGIADFMMPAVWQGIFRTVHIFKNLIPMPLKEQEMVMRFDPHNGLSASPYLPFLHAAKKKAGDPSYRFYTHRENGLNGKEDFTGAEHIVLDVDLDYFCWDNALTTVPEKRMEITKEAYEEYWSDRNHPFRILPKQYIYPAERDGRFYLIYSENAERDPLPSEEMVKTRIDRLFRYFKKCELQPEAVDVCRSTYSGYLPAERAEFTESYFLEKLQEMWPVEMIEV